MPSGSILFRAHGPTTRPPPARPAFTSNAVTLSVDGEHTSPDFIPVTAGIYRWIATYSGDASNESVTGSRNDANESVTVAPAQSTPSTELVTPPTKPAR